MALKEVRLTNKRKLLELEDITNHSGTKKVKLCYKSNDDTKLNVSKNSNDSLLENSPTQNLDEHADYIALTSSLRMVENASTKIESDIIQLQKLHQYYSTCDNKQDMIDFFVKVLKNEVSLPKQVKIPKCPSINWSKYTKNSKERPSSQPNDAMFTKVKIFDTKSCVD
jgi:hypothetical protein